MNHAAHKVFLLLACLFLSSLQFGCSTQRSLVIVKRDGLRAYDKQNFDQALADFQEYVDRNPTSAPGRYNLGLTLLELHKPKAAAEHLFVAADLEPANDTYLSAHYRALFEADRRDDLYRLLRTAATDQGRVQDHLLLGQYALKMGDVDEARQALLTAAQVDQGRSAEPQLALADFYQAVNDNTNALRRLRMALYVDPTNPTTQERIRSMGEIPGPTLTLVPEEAR